MTSLSHLVGAMASVPHRTPRSVQKELEQGKYGDDGSLPGNRFLEARLLFT